MPSLRRGWQTLNSSQLTIRIGQKPHHPPDCPDRASTRDDILFSDVERDEGRTIERLPDPVKLPGDSTQTLERLESFLRLAETLKKKVGAMGDGATNVRVVAISIEKLQGDLTEIEETIAEVRKQTEDAARQRSVLDAKNAELDAELETKNKRA